MNKISLLPKIAVLMVFMYAQPGVAYELVEKAAPDAMKLTADDYAEIQQLAIRYAWLLDHCTNGGYDYAGLYVDDGQFSTADDWGTSSNEQRTSLAKGREALARAAGGGANGKCVPPKEYLGYGITHIVTNHMITPTKTGAVGKHRLIAVGICGYPHLMELQGGYEDVYVKTKEGWKFKSRTHVFEKTRSLQFGICANK
jgi:SnoaL-like domain